MKPCSYEIRLEGHLGPTLSLVFQELEVRYDQQDTVLCGVIQDQAALYGVLLRIFNLGLSLVSVNRISILHN